MTQPVLHIESNLSNRDKSDTTKPRSRRRNKPKKGKKKALAQRTVPNTDSAADDVNTDVQPSRKRNVREIKKKVAAKTSKVNVEMKDESTASDSEDQDRDSDLPKPSTEQSAASNAVPASDPDTAQSNEDDASDDQASDGEASDGEAERQSDDAKENEKEVVVGNESDTNGEEHEVDMSATESEDDDGELPSDADQESAKTPSPKKQTPKKNKKRSRRRAPNPRHSQRSKEADKEEASEHSDDDSSNDAESEEAAVDEYVSPVKKKSAKKRKRPFGFTPRIRRTSVKRFALSKTVLVTVRKNQSPMRGWIADMEDNEILVKYKEKKGERQMAEKWFKRTDHRVKLFNRLNKGK